MVMAALWEFSLILRLLAGQGNDFPQIMATPRNTA
jgi:hypothetical protein